MNFRGTIVFDFDGVTHKYSGGWKDGSIYDEPNMKAIEAISHLQNSGYAVVIQSTRNPQQIVDWFCDNHLLRCIVIPDSRQFWNDINIVGVTNRKLPALVYVDDRAVRYNNESTIELLNNINEIINK